MSRPDAVNLLLWAAGADGGVLSSRLSPYAQILGLGSIGLAFLLALLIARLLVGLKNSPGGLNVAPVVVFGALGTFVLIFGLYLVAQYYDQGKMTVAEHDRQMRAQKADLDEIIDTMKNMNMLSGKIREPKEAAVLDRRKIECSGTVSKFHKESGLHLWLAVEVKGGIWPKEPELAVDAKGEWSATIFQDGPESPFSLDLLVVNDRTHQKFVDWINGRKFDRIEWPEGALRLDRVDGLRIQEKP